ncbi:MAG: hypothetical protein PF501_03365 [Salinisphaera sp.]|nr:hypothetical protein [Salinisphaera sp.]
MNGVEQPYVQLPAQWIRLRILNGSNARFYNLAFEDNRSFHVVGSDAGLLEQPVAMKHLLMAPAERYKMLVDLRGLQGKRLVLRSDSGTVVPNLVSMSMGIDSYDHGHFDLLELRVVAARGKRGQLPEKLAHIQEVKSDEPVREFTLQGMKGGKVMHRMMGMGPAYRAALTTVPEA